MDADDAEEEEGPLFAWLPPDDRLWRHPSEANTVPLPTLAPVSSAPRSVLTPGRVWTVAVMAGVLGAIVASGVGMAVGTFDRPVTVVQPVTRVMASDTAEVTAPSASSAEWQPSVANSTEPSVVSVAGASASGTATGSGVLYASAKDADRAYLITEGDLVDGAGHIVVTFNDGTSAAGHLVGSDPETGVALVWVSASNRTYPTLGSVADLRVVQPVLAIGDAGASQIEGTVEALDQEVNSPSGYSMTGLISVSATPSFANAPGGALVDQAGNVVGITLDVTSSNPNNQGLSYAVPIDQAMHIAQQLLAGQTLTHPWLGVTDSVDLSSRTAQAMGLSGGAEVQTVIPGSPASAAGLAVDDVIISFGGQPVTSSGALSALVDRCQPGAKDVVTYVRDGHTQSTTVTITNQPQQVGG